MFYWGRARWVGGLSQHSRDAQCHGEPRRAQAQFPGAVGWVVLLSLRARAACLAEEQPLDVAHPCSCTPAPRTHPVPHPARWQGRGAAWDSPGGQSHLFTPYHSSSEIMSVLSMPQASCLANPYLCHTRVAAARCQGAGRQNGQGYSCGSDAQ